MGLGCFSHDSGVFAERFALRSSGALGGSGRPVLMQHGVYREVGCSQGSAPRPGKLPGVLPGPASALCPRGRCPPRSWGTEPTSQVLSQLSAPGVTRQLASPCPGPLPTSAVGPPRGAETRPHRTRVGRPAKASLRQGLGGGEAADRPRCLRLHSHCCSPHPRALGSQGLRGPPLRCHQGGGQEAAPPQTQ